MPLELPDAVTQQLGWSPLPQIPGADPQVAAPVAPQLDGSMPQPQGMQAPTPDNLAPPPPAQLPQIPSLAAPTLGSTPPADATSPTHPDFRVPASAVNGPGNGPAPSAQQPQAKSTAPSKPPSIDQQVETLRQRQEAVDQRAQEANAEQLGVNLQQADADKAAYDKHAEDAKVIEDQQKAWDAEREKTRTEKQTYADSLQKEADNYKVDQNKYWNDMGVGQHIGLYIAMALSGLGDALQHKSGPNPVIQMLQDKMNQSIVLQEHEREALNQKAGRADQSVDRYDKFSSDQQARIDLKSAHADKALANALLTTAANLKAPQAIATAKAQAAALEQSAIDKTNQAVERASSRDLQQQQVAIARTNAAISSGHLALDQKKFKADEEFRSWTKEKEQQQLDLQAAKLALSEQKAGKTEDLKLGVAAPTADGKVGMLTNKDGTVVHFRTPEIAQKTSDMVAGATAYNRLVTKMTQAIKDHGGSSSFVKGAEWQKMMSDLQSATAELHDAYGITAFREPTVKFFEEMASSGVDPTSFTRDASAALLNSNENLQKKVNEKLSAAGYDGAPVVWAPTDAPEAKPTVVQQLSTVLKQEQTQNPSEIHDKAFNAAYKANGGDLAAAKQAAADAEAAVRRGGVGPDQQQAILNLEAIAKAGGPEAKDAIAALKDIVDTKDTQFRLAPRGVIDSAIVAHQKTSPTPLRAAAQAALERLTTPPAEPPPISSAGPTFSPQGYDPESLVKRFTSPVQPTLPTP